MSGPAQDDTGYATAEDTPLLLAPGDLLANDPAGTSILTIGNAYGGTVDYDIDGNIVFTPTPNYFGDAYFEYFALDDQGEISVAVVSVAITAVNENPVAQNDGGFFTTEDTPLFISGSVLRMNDSDPEGDAVSIQSVQDAVGGSVALDQNGNILFTPAADYYGPASFTYTISDGNGGTATATVDITVDPSNDSPEAGIDSAIAVVADTPLTIAAATLLANDDDVDGDTVSIVGVSNSVNGRVALNAQGDIVFTPYSDFRGPASFQYSIADGLGGYSTTQVHLIVGTGNAFGLMEDRALTVTAPQLLPYDPANPQSIQSVQDAVGGTVTMDAQGVISFVPVADYYGPASFTYTTLDALGNLTTSTVDLTVRPVNDKPVAVADHFDAEADTPLVLTAAQLLANDTDIEGDTLTILAVTAAQNGTVSLDQNGNITFTPAAGYTGDASFNYVVRDGNGGFTLGTANLSITNSVTGDAGDNTLTGSSGLDVITGAGGDDLMSGGTGSDTYRIDRGDGIDTVVQAGITDAAASTDTVQFCSGVAHDQLWFRQVGDDLRIDVIGETASSVLLADWYSDAASRIDRIDAVDGSYSLSAANVENLVSAMAAFSPPAAGQMTLAAAGLNDDLAGVLAANWQAA